MFDVFQNVFFLKEALIILLLGIALIAGIILVADFFQKKEKEELLSEEFEDKLPNDFKFNSSWQDGSKKILAIKIVVLVVLFSGFVFVFSYKELEDLKNSIGIVGGALIAFFVAGIVVFSIISPSFLKKKKVKLIDKEKIVTIDEGKEEIYKWEEIKCFRVIKNQFLTADFASLFFEGIILAMGLGDYLNGTFFHLMPKRYDRFGFLKEALIIKFDGDKQQEKELRSFLLRRIPEERSFVLR